jgi:hypothetical protein
MKRQPRLDLIQLIKDNPGCHATIDNDCWWLDKQHPDNNPHDYTEEKAYESWEESNKLVSSSDNYFVQTGNSIYQSGNCYGGDLLLALAEIVGMTTESV